MFFSTLLLKMMAPTRPQHIIVQKAVLVGDTDSDTSFHFESDDDVEGSETSKQQIFGGNEV